MSRYFLHEAGHNCIDWIYELDSIGVWRLVYNNQNGWAKCTNSAVTNDPRTHNAKHVTELTKEELFAMLL